MGIGSWLPPGGGGGCKVQSLLLGEIGFRDPQDPFTETSLRAQRRGGVVKEQLGGGLVV